MRVALLAALLASAWACAAQEPGSAAELEARTFEIARELRCPVCVSESVADSNSQISVQMRELIQEQLEAGRSRAEILAYFQERYGDWILLSPPKRGLHLLVWLLPLLAAALGLALLALLLLRWTRASREVPEVSEQELQRVRQALVERD